MMPNVQQCENRCIAAGDQRIDQQQNGVRFGPLLDFEDSLRHALPKGVRSQAIDRVGENSDHLPAPNELGHSPDDGPRRPVGMNAQHLCPLGTGGHEAILLR